MADDLPPGVFVGPAPRVKPIHRAKLISEEGHVSPLCAKTPRPIDLRQASWTLRDAAVTCPKCKRIITTAASLPETPEAT